MVSACTVLFLGVFVVVAEQTAEPKIEFGHELLPFFMMRAGYVNLNNGAFGSGLKAAYQRQHELDLQMETDANEWFRGGYQPLLVDVRQRLAAMVKCDVSSLVMVENASCGANAVLRSLATTMPLQVGDGILHLNVVYPMVRNVINFLARERNLEVVECNITAPVLTTQSILDALRASLNEHPHVKVAALDWIASYPAVVLPIKEMIELCHERGVFVFVDAAHNLGQTPMDLQDIKADALVANAHKWLNSPKSAAILFVDPVWHAFIVPSVISSEFDGDFADRFIYTGTRSYNAMAAIDAALDFREFCGDIATMDYMKTLAWEAAGRVASLWGTSTLFEDPALHAALVCVVTPTQDGVELNRVRADLLSAYDTYIQTSVYNGVYYIRLSAQVYLEVSDFELMAERFLLLLQNSHNSTTSVQAST